MKQYEVTFIVDPVLSGDEIKATAQAYVDMLQQEGATIVHVDEMGLKQLAYPINKRLSGVYFCVEFQTESGLVIDKTELALRRDERIMRFLTVALDKYGVKFNEDRRSGLIGKKKKKENKEETSASPAPAKVAEAPAPAKVVEVAAPVAAPVVEAVAPIAAPVVEAAAPIVEAAAVNEEE